MKHIITILFALALTGCMSAQYRTASALGQLVNRASIDDDVYVTVTEPREIGKKAAEAGKTIDELRVELAKNAKRRATIIGALLTLANLHDKWIRAIEDGNAPPISELIAAYCTARDDMPEAKLPDGGLCNVVQ